MNPTLQVILDHTLNLVVLIAVPVILTLIHKWLQTKKMDQFANIADFIVTQAVSYGEEQAHKALKAGEKPDSAKKLDAAITFVEDEFKRMGYDTMARDQIQKWVESKLGETRQLPSSTTTEEPKP